MHFGKRTYINAIDNLIVKCILTIDRLLQEFIMNDTASTNIVPIQVTTSDDSKSTEILLHQMQLLLCDFF